MRRNLKWIILLTMILIQIGTIVSVVRLELRIAQNEYRQQVHENYLDRQRRRIDKYHGKEKYAQEAVCLEWGIPRTQPRR